MRLLFQFPISHYCEKVSWALDFKELEYRKVNLFPGPHVFVTKFLGDKTSVPILTDGTQSIQDSTKIIDYLEKKYPSHKLNYKNKKQAQEVLDMEDFLDKEAGVHLRRYFYFISFQNPKFIQELLSIQNPCWTPYFIKVFFPVLKSIMTQSMNIYEEPSLQSKERLEGVIAKLNRRLSDHDFLVGDFFTRADITAASLLAPIARPKEHPFPWPDELPGDLADFADEYEDSPLVNWIRKIYENHRKIQS